MGGLPSTRLTEDHNHLLGDICFDLLIIINGANSNKHILHVSKAGLIFKVSTENVLIAFGQRGGAKNL